MLKVIYKALAKLRVQTAFQSMANKKIHKDKLSIIKINKTNNNANDYHYIH